MIRQRELILKQRPAHDLIDGVMPPDVLAQCQQGARSVEKSGGMQAPSATKDLLAGAQAVRQAAQDFGIYAEIRIRSAQSAAA